MRASNDIDMNADDSNMFGIAPCPECGSECRWPTQPIHPIYPNSILCDDCGYIEPIGKDRTNEPF